MGYAIGIPHGYVAAGYGCDYMRLRVCGINLCDMSYTAKAHNRPYTKWTINLILELKR